MLTLSWSTVRHQIYCAVSVPSDAGSVDCGRTNHYSRSLWDKTSTVCFGPKINRTIQTVISKGSRYHQCPWQKSLTLWWCGEWRKVHFWSSMRCHHLPGIFLKRKTQNGIFILQKPGWGRRGFMYWTDLQSWSFPYTTMTNPHCPIP